jgi:hypothetical protein
VPSADEGGRTWGTAVGEKLWHDTQSFSKNIANIAVGSSKIIAHPILDRDHLLCDALGCREAPGAGSNYN